jgi:membrane-bound ClpP family serine protease
VTVPEQVLGAAIIAVIVILGVVGIVRVARRPRPDASAYGAGGSSRVPNGTTGVARTPIAADGVVYAVGEEWTARSVDGATIPAGVAVSVIDHDGLTLVVEAVPADPSAGQ